ncbi:hypothetical protein [Stutzerimonas azotifigens]|uniref:hypothetical protein n=1 Tax=Stutzerimonas azotifigens TaxID=291995 RepID=UPI000409EAB8|nr:hypothetical protein [Stutzerimonas azotifigens]
MRRLAWLPVLASLVACSERAALDDALAEGLASGQPVDLSALQPGPWDRACVLPPYTTDPAAETILGTPWEAGRYTDIAMSDAIAVLVFLDGRRVAAHVEMPRRRGDLAGLVPRCMDRSNARLQEREERVSWLTGRGAAQNEGSADR